MTAKKLNPKQPGGPPIGNTNGANSRRWKQAIDKATKQYYCKEVKDDNGVVIREKVKAGFALDAMAVKLVRVALHADGPDMVFAFKEIGSRLDGKATEHKVIESRTTEGLEGLSEAAELLRAFARYTKDESDEGTVSH